MGEYGQPAAEEQFVQDSEELLPLPQYIGWAAIQRPESVDGDGGDGQGNAAKTVEADSEYAHDDLDDAVVTTDSVRAYLNEISRYPLLKAEDEVRLAQEIEVGLVAEKVLELQKSRNANQDEASNKFFKNCDPSVLAMLEKFTDIDPKLLEAIAKKGLSQRMR
jgi:RNA polymerase primary sigma factor